MIRARGSLPGGISLKYCQVKATPQSILYNTTRIATLDPIDKSNPSEMINEDELSLKVVDPLIDLFDSNPTATAMIRKTEFRGRNLVIERTPDLPEIESNAFQYVFDKKIISCCQICNFEYEDADKAAKKVKCQLLENIYSFLQTLNDTENKLSAQNVEKVLQMILANVSRHICENNITLNLFDLVPNSTVQQWPHLSIIYQILINLVRNYPKIIPLSFTKAIIPNLNSSDENERIQVKFFIGAYCIQLPENSHTVIIILLKMLYDYRSGEITPFCVNPILELLRELFKSMDVCVTAIIFESHLLPLLSSHHLPFYIDELNIIMKFFMEKEQKHVNSVIDYILKYYPRTKMKKQVQFIQLFIETIPKLSQRDFSCRINKIFSIFADANISCSAKVAETALQLWQSLEIQAMIGIFSMNIFPIIWPSILIAREHWSVAVRQLATKAFEFAKKTNKKYVNENTNIIMITCSNEMKSTDRWKTIASYAALNDANLNLEKVIEKIEQEKVKRAYTITNSNNYYNSYAMNGNGNRAQQMGPPMGKKRGSLSAQGSGAIIVLPKIV